MKVGLYFGSFNPIHIGHLIIAEFVRQHTDLQQVWFVVSPQNPFKKSSSLLNAYHRLHLIKLAIEGNANLQATDIEFNLPIPSYTINTLTYLKEKYTTHQFVIVMGSDSFQNIKKWKNSNILLKEYSFVIYVRQGFEIDDFYGADCKVVAAPILQISSTYIREQIKNKKSIRYLVPDAVYNEIISNRYYL